MGILATEYKHLKELKQRFSSFFSAYCVNSVIIFLQRFFIYTILIVFIFKFFYYTWEGNFYHETNRF